jgi:hypothetical protein
MDFFLFIKNYKIKKILINFKNLIEIYLIMFKKQLKLHFFHLLFHKMIHENQNLFLYQFKH